MTSTPLSSALCTAVEHTIRDAADTTAVASAVRNAIVGADRVGLRGVAMEEHVRAVGDTVDGEVDGAVRGAVFEALDRRRT